MAIQSVSAWPEKRGEIKKQVVEVAEVSKNDGRKNRPNMTYYDEFLMFVWG